MFSMKGTTHSKAEAGKHGPSSLHGNQSSGYTEGGHVSHEDSKGCLLYTSDAADDRYVV